MNNFLCNQQRIILSSNWRQKFATAICHYEKFGSFGPFYFLIRFNVEGNRLQSQLTIQQTKNILKQTCEWNMFA